MNINNKKWLYSHLIKWIPILREYYILYLVEVNRLYGPGKKNIYTICGQRQTVWAANVEKKQLAIMDSCLLRWRTVYIYIVTVGVEQAEIR